MFFSIFAVTVFILATSLGKIGYHLIQSNLALKTCQQTTLKIQRSIKNQLGLLFALNPMARQLIAKRKKAQAKLAAAPTPVLKIAAATELSIIIAQQVGLSLKQKYILAEIKRLRIKSKFDLTNAIKKLRGRYVVVVKIGSTKLRRSPVAEIAPVYSLASQFSHLNSIKTQWTKSNSTKGESWWEHSSGHCGATILEKNTKLLLTLKGDKFLLNR